MTPIRMNLFQRIMRLWDRVHPYNAAQALLIRGDADTARYAQAWHDTLKAMGLGRLRVDGHQFSHAAIADAAPMKLVSVLRRDTPFEQYISTEMNRRFIPADTESYDYCPFRPFLLPLGDRHYTGVIYHHWAADSSSIRMLLREWFYRVHEPPRRRRTPVALARDGYWRLLGPAAGGWGLSEGILSTMRQVTRFGNARRIETPGEDYSVRCLVRTLPEGMIDMLRQTTRAMRITLHDLFLAAAAEACHRHGVTPAAPGRQELALGTVVDIRPFSRVDLREVFGLFLGFTTNVLRPAELENWPALLRTIAAQDAWHKRCHSAQVSMLRMGAAVAESLVLAPRTWLHFYLRHMPLTAGISNVNLSKTWAAEYHPRLVMEYLRFTPAGPTLPVIFTPSSLGSQAHVALTYRVGLVDEPRARRLAGAFVNRLAQVAGR